MQAYGEVLSQQEIKYESDLASDVPSSPCGLPFMSSRRASLGSSVTYSTTSSFSQIEPITPTRYDARMSFEPFTRELGLSGLTAGVVFPDPGYLESHCMGYNAPFEPDNIPPARQLCLWDGDVGFDGSVAPTNLHLVSDGSHLQQDIYDAGNGMQHGISFLPDSTATLGLQPLQCSTVVPGDIYHEAHGHSMFSPIDYDVQIHSQPNQFQIPGQQDLDHQNYMSESYTGFPIDHLTQTTTTSIAKHTCANVKTTTARRTRSNLKSNPVEPELRSERRKVVDSRAQSIIERPKIQCLWVEQGERCSGRFPRKEHMLRHIQIHIKAKRELFSAKGTAKGTRPRNDKFAEDPIYWEPLLFKTQNVSTNISNAVKEVIKEALSHGVKVPEEILKEVHRIHGNLNWVQPPPEEGHKNASSSKKRFFDQEYCTICDRYLSRADNFRQHVETVHLWVPSEGGSGRIKNARLFVMKEATKSNEGWRELTTIDELEYDMEAIEKAGLTDYYEKFYVKKKKQEEAERLKRVQERIQLELGHNITPPPTPPRRQKTCSQQRSRTKQAHRKARIQQSKRDVDRD